MKRLLLLPFLLFFSLFTKAQVQPVSCDLFVSGAEIQNQAGSTIDANTISFNQVVKYQFTLGNLNQTTAAPQGHFRVSIGLGTGFTLNTGFNLATAGLNSIFNWTYDASGSQPRIIGTSIGAFPAATDGTVIFELRATSVANSTVSNNFLITNPQGTQTPLSDPNFSNNGAANTYNIASDLVLTINSTQNVSCNGGNNGAISASASGGYTPYTFSISPMAGNQSGGNFTNLPANTYTVTVTDASNNSKNTQVTISQPTAITAATATKTDANCFGASNGTIILSGAGGTPPYAYSISGMGSNNSGATSGTFTGLPAGTYSYSITDANSCTPATGSLTVGQPAAITAATATKTDATCNGSANGKIALSGAGGTPPYTYIITGTGSNNTGMSSGMFTGLPTGTYSYSITDANSCTPATGSLTVGQPTAITAATATKTDANCFGASNGTITLSGAGGTPPYAYSISGMGSNNSGVTSGTFTGLPAGTYSYSITDANNCTPATGSLTVGQPTAITATTASKTDANCFGASNGTITLSGAGGTPPYTYTITGTGSNNTGMSSGMFTGLPAGTYSYSITDANSCTPATGSLTVGQPTAITAATATKTDANCFGASNGTITLSGAGGTPPYAYSISGMGSNNSGATSGTFTGLPAGTYSYSITDANNCTPATGSLTVGQPATVSVSLVSKMNNTCNGGTNGSITVAASGGTGAYTYAITSGPTINTTGASSGTFTGLAAGTYSLSATDANGCSGSISGIMITQPTATNPDASLSVADFTDNFFPASGDTVFIIYQVTENAGNAITSARLRTTKQGTSYVFSLPNRTSATINGITYPLANNNWTQNNSSSSFYDVNMNTGSQVPCGQSVYLGIKITRNTASKSTFTLTSVLQQINGETNTSNNSTTFVLVAQ